MSTTLENSRRRWDVVLPAGARLPDEFAQTSGVEIKALLPLKGETILHRTIGLLRSMEEIERIIVIGPEEALDEARMAGVDAALPEGDTGTENILKGFEWITAGSNNIDDHALIVTTDLPFLTVESIRSFLCKAPAGSDIVGALVTRTAFETSYSDSRREFVRLKDGEFTLGSVFMAKPATLLGIRSHIERVFQARKSQIRMARMVGWEIMLRFLSHQLTIDTTIKRINKVLNCNVGIVRDSCPELAFDIDEQHEYEYVQRF